MTPDPNQQCPIGLEKLFRALLDRPGWLEERKCADGSRAWRFPPLSELLDEDELDELDEFIEQRGFDSVEDLLKACLLAYINYAEDHA